MFSFDERLGIYFTVQSSCLSAGSVVILLLFAFYRWLRRTLATRNVPTMSDASGSSLFINLMVADLIQAVGNIINIRWMIDSEITEGQLCRAQGILKEIGINGVSLTSLAIAIHTFAVLVLRWRAPQHFSKFVVLAIWIVIALLVGVTNGVIRHDLYGNTGYWCWIMSEWKVAQIMSEYLWMWMAAILMIILYGLMFLVMRGYLVIENGIHWHTSTERVALDLTATENEEDREAKAIANLMLFYPAVYVICVLPNSISRWLSFSGHVVPHQYTLFASALFSFSGMFNVILYFSTRPELVVGPSVIEHGRLPPTSQHQTVATHINTQKYGHLPRDSGASGISHIDDGKKGLHLTLEGPHTPTYFVRENGGVSGNRLVMHDYRAAMSASSATDDSDDYGRLPI